MQMDILAVLADEGIWALVFFRSRVRSHAPSIRSHRGTKVVWPDFRPMRVPEEPVCIDLFRQKPVFTSLYLKSPVHVVPPLLLRLQGICCEHPPSPSPARPLHTVSVPNWPILRPQNSKWAELKYNRQDKSAAEFWHDFPTKGQKGPNS